MHMPQILSTTYNVLFVLSYYFLAHLSRRLMGELIVYQSLPRPSVRLNESSNGPGHVTKMAATHIYGKNPLKIFFSRTRRLMTLGLGM